MVFKSWYTASSFRWHYCIVWPFNLQKKLVSCRWREFSFSLLAHIPLNIHLRLLSCLLIHISTPSVVPIHILDRHSTESKDTLSSPRSFQVWRTMYSLSLPIYSICLSCKSKPHKPHIGYVVWLSKWQDSSVFTLVSVESASRYRKTRFVTTDRISPNTWRNSEWPGRSHQIPMRVKSPVPFERCHQWKIIRLKNQYYKNPLIYNILEQHDSGKKQRSERTPRIFLFRTSYQTNLPTSHAFPFSEATMLTNQTNSVCQQNIPWTWLSISTFPVVWLQPSRCHRT